MRLDKVLAIGVAAMGLVHIAATFTPLINGKLAVLESSARSPFVYFSLICGLFLVIGGLLSFMLSDKVSEHGFLRKPYSLLMASLAIDGVLAVCYMPHNPFAWVIFALVVVLAVLEFARLSKMK